MVAPVQVRATPIYAADKSNLAKLAAGHLADMHGHFDTNFRHARIGSVHSPADSGAGGLPGMWRTQAYSLVQVL